MDQNKRLNLGLESEFGLVRDGALYASFGLENQIFKFSKLIFNVNGSYEEDENQRWIFKMDYAPIYDYIKREVKLARKEYDIDSQGRSIDGNNFYLDWYKNLGSRIYYLGNLPFIEALVGYKSNNHMFKIGRMKTIVGFDDNHIPWGDDGKFAPMSYWLSKDLLSGISYSYNGEFGSIAGSIYSGGNPSKGYSNYLDLVESPNLKSNNTPTLAGRLQLDYDGLLGKRYSGYLYSSYMQNFTGSTWSAQIQDGKRNASVAAHGAMLNIHINDLIINQVNLFAQYTQYFSGLTKKSSQSSTNSLELRDIKQSGYFIGMEALLWDSSVSLSSAYERFSRFDYNIFKHNLFKRDSELESKKQTSYIFQAKYFPRPFMAFSAAYHAIKNPCKFQSEILDKKKDNKFKISIYFDV